jgi:hypothetical protein
MKKPLAGVFILQFGDPVFADLQYAKEYLCIAPLPTLKELPKVGVSEVGDNRIV